MRRYSVEQDEYNMNQETPSRGWAEHHYDRAQREWSEQLLQDPPDWSQLQELDQQLRSLEAYLSELDLSE